MAVAAGPTPLASRATEYTALCGPFLTKVASQAACAAHNTGAGAGEWWLATPVHASEGPRMGAAFAAASQTCVDFAFNSTFLGAYRTTGTNFFWDGGQPVTEGWMANSPQSDATYKCLLAWDLLGTATNFWYNTVCEFSVNDFFTLSSRAMCQRYAPCSNTLDCNNRGVGGTTGYYPHCQCNGCIAGYTGINCQDVICTKADDCNAATTVSVSGIRPACNCTCQLGYVGAQCQTRVCHKDVDCTGRGTGISGNYPDCVCACQRGFGGRRCRTLSTTQSKSRSSTQSASPLSPSHTVSMSTTVTYSLSPTPRTSSPTPSYTASTATHSRASPSLSMSLGTPSVTASLFPTTSATSSLGSATPTQSLTGTFSMSLTASQRSRTASHSPSPSQTSSHSPTTSATMSASISRAVSASKSCPLSLFAGPAVRRLVGGRDTDGPHAVWALPVYDRTVPYEALRDDTAFAAPVLLRTDFPTNDVSLLNISAVLEAVEAPDSRWQPRGLMALGPVPVYLDYYANGSITVRGEVCCGVPALLLDEPEVAQIAVLSTALFGCGADAVWLALGRIRIEPGPSAVAQALTAIATAGSATGTANDLQAIAVMGIMPCAAGVVRGVGASAKALSPFSFTSGGDRGIGATGTANTLFLIGALIAAILASFAASLHFREPEGGADETGIVRALTALRLPGLLLAAAMALYQGTLAAAVATLADPTGAQATPLDMAAAAVAVVALAGVPILCAVVSRRYVTRCVVHLDYRLSLACPSETTAHLRREELEVAAAEEGAASWRLTSERWLRVAAWVLPRGVVRCRSAAAMFGPAIAFFPSPDPPPTPAATSPGSSNNTDAGADTDPQTSSPRMRLLSALTHHHAWAAVPALSAWVMAVGVAVPVRDGAWCRGMYVLMAACHGVLALWVGACRPHLAPLKSVLAASALAVNGLLLLMAAVAIGLADVPAVRGITTALIGLQVAIGGLRTAHAAALVVWALAVRVALRMGWLRAPPLSEADGQAKGPVDDCSSPKVGADGPVWWVHTATAGCVIAQLRNMKVRRPCKAPPDVIPTLHQALLSDPFWDRPDTTAAATLLDGHNVPPQLVDTGNDATATPSNTTDLSDVSASTEEMVSVELPRAQRPRGWTWCPSLDVRLEEIAADSADHRAAQSELAAEETATLRRLGYQS